jgi:hypothetical protein
MTATVAQLAEWLRGKENEHLEFKEARNNFHFDKLVKYCAALANDGGGVIILGVTDRPPRRVVGSSAFPELERTKAGLIDRCRGRRSRLHRMPPHDAVPTAVQPRFEEIAALIDDVCLGRLTAEYATLARALAVALARKRLSPLLRGTSRTWACGITYTIGSVNFLFDPGQPAHVRAQDLCGLFGVSQSAGAARSREIARLLDIVPLDPRWTLPSRLADNPLVWMISSEAAVR